MATIVRAKELGQFLKLSESTIYKLAKSSQLPGFKIGDSWRFELEEVVDLIEKAKGENCRK
jgi:excisionase family DNA binding protein